MLGPGVSRGLTCKVRIEDTVFEANLIPLSMTDFDAILGMDWLSTNRASIDCFTKRVEFRKPRQPPLVFTEDRLVLPRCVISVIKARRLVHHGGTAYLAHVIDTTMQGPQLEKVLVVQEFLDVFSKELPRLPPILKFDFEIDVVGQLRFLWHHIG